jgi:hypothetical protein
MQQLKQYAIVTTIAVLAALMVVSTVTSEQVNAATSAKALKAQIKALKSQLKAAKAAKKATQAAKLQAKIKKLQARLAAATDDTGNGGAQAATGSTGGDSQTIHQANHNTQSTSCSANGGNGNVTGGAGGTNNCSNTNTQSNTNSGSNTHA